MPNGDAWALGIVMSLWILLGFWWFQPYWRDHQAGLAAHAWPTTQGRVVTSGGTFRFVQQGQRSIKVPDIDLRYQYSFEGKAYEGRQVRGSAIASHEVESLLARYAPGASITVHVDPSNPARSLLELPVRGARSPMVWLALWCSPVLLLIWPLQQALSRWRRRTVSAFAPSVELVECVVHLLRAHFSQRGEQQAMDLLYMLYLRLRRGKPRARFAIAAHATVARNEDAQEYSATSQHFRLELDGDQLTLKRHTNLATLGGAKQYDHFEERADLRDAGTKGQVEWLNDLKELTRSFQILATVEACQGETPLEVPRSASAASQSLGIRIPSGWHERWYSVQLSRFTK